MISIVDQKRNHINNKTYYYPIQLHILLARPRSKEAHCLLSKQPENNHAKLRPPKQTLQSGRPAEINGFEGPVKKEGNIYQDER